MLPCYYLLSALSSKMATKLKQLPLLPTEFAEHFKWYNTISQTCATICSYSRTLKLTLDFIYLRNSNQVISYSFIYLSTCQAYNQMIIYSFIKLHLFQHLHIILFIHQTWFISAPAYSSNFIYISQHHATMISPLIQGRTIIFTTAKAGMHLLEWRIRAMGRIYM